MYTNFLQEMPYVGGVRYREINSRGDVSWDLKEVSAIKGPLQRGFVQEFDRHFIRS